MARDVPYLVVKGRGFYEATEIGDEMELTYSHDGEEQSLTRVKVEASGMIRMGSHP